MELEAGEVAAQDEKTLDERGELLPNKFQYQTKFTGTQRLTVGG